MAAEVRTLGHAEEASPPAALWAWATVAVTIAGIASGCALANRLPRQQPAISLGGAGGLGWLLFLGSSVHVASTSCLLVTPGSGQVVRRHPLRCRWIPLTLIVAAAVGALVVPARATSWSLVVIFAWQSWHFQKQNVGLVALVNTSLGLPRLQTNERQTLMSAGGAGVIGLLAHPALLGLTLSSPFQSLWLPARLLLAGSVLWGLRLVVARPRSARPPAFCSLYLLSLGFWVPMFAFRSPYAAVGGMTIAHGLQYLLLCGLVISGARPGRVTRLSLWLNAALVGGAALSWASHLHGSASALRVLFGVYTGILMSHFVVDSALWRLRDPVVRHWMGSRVPFLWPALT